VRVEKIKMKEQGEKISERRNWDQLMQKEKLKRSVEIR
jgi:hypothetical protein